MPVFAAESQKDHFYARFFGPRYENLRRIADKNNIVCNYQPGSEERSLSSIFLMLAHQNLGGRNNREKSLCGFQIFCGNNYLRCGDIPKENAWMVQAWQGTHRKANQTQRARRTQIGWIEKVSRNAWSSSQISLRGLSKVWISRLINREFLTGHRRELIHSKFSEWVSKISILFAEIARCISCSPAIFLCSLI